MISHSIVLVLNIYIRSSHGAYVATIALCNIQNSVYLSFKLWCICATQFRRILCLLGLSYQIEMWYRTDRFKGPVPDTWFFYCYSHWRLSSHYSSWKFQCAIVKKFRNNNHVSGFFLVFYLFFILNASPLPNQQITKFIQFDSWIWIAISLPANIFTTYYIV